MKTLLGLLVLFSTTLSAQTYQPTKADKGSFEGPETTEVGNAVWLTLKDAIGSDPKFVCSPPSDKWRALKTFEGAIVINFAPGKEESGKTFTFFVASNKDGQTLLTLHTISVGGKPPTPIVPDNALTDRLKPFYLTSPNKDDLVKLIEVLKDVSTQEPDSLRFANTLLKSETAKKFNETDNKREHLVPLRDEIGKVILEKFGNNPSAVFDKKAFSQLMKDLATALEKL